jgi:transposase
LDERKLDMVQEDAAGVDIGSREHWVAVPADRDAAPVQKFGTTTGELRRLVEWLVSCRITTVAMESTGVYWVPLFDLLEAAGFEVVLVNAKHLRNVPGRKSDVMDCQWIQKLHSYGLLRASFRPTADIVELRTFTRHRETLIESAAREAQHMQKALQIMNVQIHHAVSDITGVTGMAIVRAIVGGETNPVVLAKHRDCRCRVSPEDLAKALTGTYKADQLFVLKQSLEMWDAYQARLTACDAKIAAKLAELETAAVQSETATQSETAAQSETTATTGPNKASVAPKAMRRRVRKNPRHLDSLAPALIAVTRGVDLTAIPGIGTVTGLNLLAEIGLDMKRWRTEKHFTSWLNLAPGTTKTGGVLKTGKRPPRQNAAGLILRQAAVSVGRTRTALGAFYRRIARTSCSAKAVVATARKLAVLVYNLLLHGENYVNESLERYEAQYQARRVDALAKAAKSLGYELRQIAEAEPAGA